MLRDVAVEGLAACRLRVGYHSLILAARDRTGLPADLRSCKPMPRP